MNHEEKKRTKWDDDGLSFGVIGAAIRVHQALGPGLLESIYHRSFAFELVRAGFEVAVEVPLALRYEECEFPCAYRADLIIQQRLLVEVKAVKSLEQIHLAQILTYLRLAGLRTGLLINFNVTQLRDGLRRVVLDVNPSCPSSLRGSNQ